MRPIRCGVVSHCRIEKALNSTLFRPCGIGQFTKTCRNCSVRVRAESCKKQCQANKENDNPCHATSKPEQDDDEKDLDGLSDLSLDAFLSLISEINDVTSIAARVDVSDLDGSVREKADKLSGHATVANRNMIVITCASILFMLLDVRHLLSGVKLSAGELGLCISILS